MLDQLHGAAHASPADMPVPAPVQPPPQPSVVIPKDHPLFDHAKSILSDMAATDANTAADAWDAFHSARTPAELTTRLQALPLPPEIAARLIEAKSPPKDAVDKMLGAMMAIPKETLDLAEAHPKVLEHFTKAIRKE